MKMTNQQLSRSADLNFAFQHGRDYAKGDITAKKDFERIFVGDQEAKQQYGADVLSVLHRKGKKHGAKAYSA
jgi:hypothetical protein